MQTLPAEHIDSLSQIESGYWWYQGRIFWARELVRLAEHTLGISSPWNYLDLGCGTGGFAKELRESIAVKRAGLVDGDKKVLSLAERYPGFEVHQVDLNSEFTLPWRPSLVTCMDVIEHLEKDDIFLRKVSENMERPGALVLSVPAHPWLYSEWDRRLGHYRRYTKGALSKLLRRSGLEIVFCRHMWSFLMPAAPIRLLCKSRYQQSMAFEKASPLINQTLVTLSSWEWTLAKRIPFPFGTSLIALAVKK